MLRMHGQERPERAVPPKRKADDEVYGSENDAYEGAKYTKRKAPMSKKSSFVKSPNIFSFMKAADEIQARDYLKTPTEDLYSPMETTEMQVDELPCFDALAAVGVFCEEKDDPELVSLMSRVGRMSVVPAEEDDEDLRLVDALLDRTMDRASCSLAKQLKIFGQRSLSTIPDEEISLSGDGFGGESTDMDCAL